MELLAAETCLDALIVATPPLFHADAVLAGVKAGLPVLCEKPLALDTSAFDGIRRASKSRGLAVYSVNNWAYSPQWLQLLALSTSGRFGAVRRVEIRVLRSQPSHSATPGSWRRNPAISGGGILVDHGWHALYLLRRLLGPSLKLAAAFLNPRSGVEEIATVHLQAPGASGIIHLSWRAPKRLNSALITHDRGTLELQDDTILVTSQGRDERLRFPRKLSAGSAHPDWLAAMWPAFEAACSDPCKRENLSEAAFCLRMIRQAYGRKLEAHV